MKGAIRKHAPATWLKPLVGMNDTLRFGRYKGLLARQLVDSYRGASYLLLMDELGWLVLRDQLRHVCEYVVEKHKEALMRGAIPEETDLEGLRQNQTSKKKPLEKLPLLTGSSRYRATSHGDMDSNAYIEDRDRFEAEYGYSRDWFA